ncbi:MAG TPA: lamin tail domain-containing protein, partial [Kofleriaceae bacterium]|nr:lamin tail domain-containing protein [Kofleriaceae bacterium]
LDPAVAALAPGHARSLRVLLDAETPTPLTVCLASSQPSVAAPASATVTVPAGATETELEVQGVAAAAGPAVIRAWRAATGAACGAPPGAAVKAHIAVTDDRIASAGDLLFNEVLSDPPGVEGADIDGDASCDGLRDSDDDEFIELVNVTDEVLDLSGVRVRDKLPAEVERHVFAAGTRLAPGEAILLYGAPVGSASSPWCAALAGVQVVSASGGTGLHLNNAGDTVTLLDAGGAVIGTFQYSALVGAHDQSLTRDPDLGADVVLYGFADDHMADRAFSPGTHNDGSSFE